MNPDDIKAVLDTSILVAAFLKPSGTNNKVLLKAENGYQLVLSDFILQETERVLKTYSRLQEKYNYHEEEVDEFLFLLQNVSHVVYQKVPQMNIIDEDPDDNPIIGTGVKGNVEFIVSKDQHLLNLDSYENIVILSTDTFFRQLK